MNTTTTFKSLSGVGVVLAGTVSAIAVLGLATVKPATAAEFVTFETDPSVSVPNGFVSNPPDSQLVSFSDTLGANLVIGNFGVQGNGQSLAVGFDDASALKMNFSHLMKSLSLDFGNDDPYFSSPGDTAELTLFLGATQVGVVSVPMNRDDIMNQTISFAASGPGQYFDMATFFYNVAVPTPAGTSGLIEVVDNIEFQPAGKAVPEPSTVLGLGLLGLVALVKRQLMPKQDSDKA